MAWEQNLSPDREGIDCDIAEAWFATLKAPWSRASEKGKSSENSKKGEGRNNDVSASPKWSGKAGNKPEQTGNLTRSTSAESDGVDSLEAELMARLQALRTLCTSADGELSSISGSSTNSASNTPSLNEKMQALKSRSKKPPQVSLLHLDLPTSMSISSTSVGSSGWCAPTSPFKLTT